MLCVDLCPGLVLVHTTSALIICGMIELSEICIFCSNEISPLVFFTRSCDGPVARIMPDQTGTETCSKEAHPRIQPQEYKSSALAFEYAFAQHVGKALDKFEGADLLQ